MRAPVDENRNGNGNAYVDFEKAGKLLSMKTEHPSSPARLPKLYKSYKLRVSAAN